MADIQPLTLQIRSRLIWLLNIILLLFYCFQLLPFLLALSMLPLLLLFHLLPFLSLLLKEDPTSTPAPRTLTAPPFLLLLLYL